MTLIAEDVLLLLLDGTKGTVSIWESTDPVLGGAVLAELALAGLVTLDGRRRGWRGGKVEVTGEPPVDLHPVLADALVVVAEKERKASALVTRIGKGLEPRLAAGLVEGGIVERRQGRRLGLLPRTTWPAADTRREMELRRSVTACLALGAQPDDRTRALIALLAAADQAHRAVTEDTRLPNRRLKQRAKELSDGLWFAQAVTDARNAAAASS